MFKSSKQFNDPLLNGVNIRTHGTTTTFQNIAHRCEYGLCKNHQESRTKNLVAQEYSTVINKCVQAFVKFMDTVTVLLQALVTWLVTSVCSRSECTHSTVLYGSTHAEEICGHDHTVNEIFDFLP